MIDFIENIGDYFSQHFFTDDFPKKVFDKSGFVSQGKTADGEKVENHISTYNQSVGALRRKYDKFKNDYLSLKRKKDRAKLAHDFNTELLTVLGYQNGTKSYDQPVILEDNKVIPVRYRFNKGDKPYLYVMEMMPMIQEGDTTPDGLYEQNYTYEDWESVLPESFEEYEIKPEVIKEALSELFLLPEDERPEYLIMLAGPKVFLIQYEKWKYDSYLMFDLEEMFVLSQIPANKNFLALFYALLAKKQFISESESVLASLEEDAHKASYGVTKTLKNAVIFAVESLANEAIEYKRSQLVTIEDKKEILNLLENEKFAQELKDDCLTFVYRLLFLFYAESREDLEILPVNDSTYQKGYSMEMLRDLEMVQLTTESSRNGFFFSDSLWKLFKFLHEGREEKDGFILKPLDSPLFDNSALNHLGGIRFRNSVLQEIVLRLSLSERTRNKSRGRISYSNLGINQLGSVYESLLAYSGFFAKEDLIEVKAAKDRTGKDGTFLVPKSRRDDFKEDEILKDPEHPSEDVTVKRGQFVYRLNGRDRKKSASYYTPEVLTQCTVKYTLKGILDKLRENQNIVDGELKGKYCADEILDLKILEPAMGAAAFHNEVINQLAVAYLELKENEEVHKGRKRIVPGNYKDELQKVKAYIAANNVYGVDLNPTAVELGKLSLWLNCMHKNMETPFFGHRLGAGNAVVGAWLKVYDKSDIIEEFPAEGTPAQRRKPLPKEWWSKAPTRVKWNKSNLTRKEDQIYHFLLPDANMVPSFGIKLLKEELTDVEKKAFTDWRNDFKSPITKEEHKRLSKISRVIDHLLDEHYKQILGVIKDTSSVYPVYGKESPQVSLKGYDEKERLADSRNSRTAPYYKLKMIMDYWCSLWFWDVRNVKDLPSRSQWYNEVESLLNIDTSTLSENASEQDIKSELRKNSTDLSLFSTSERIETVEELSKSHRFFHNELEFIEVFKERGGFDVVVGNPPWLKLTFEEKGIMSELFPELEIRKVSAPKVKDFRDEYLSNVANKESYYLEYISTDSSSSFLNAYQNYSLLKGQQTDIYKCVINNCLEQLNSSGSSGLVHPESVFDDPNGEKFRIEMYKFLSYHFHFKNVLKLFQEVHHRLDYSVNVYSKAESGVNFSSVSNLLHPNQLISFNSADTSIDNSITIKNKEGKWSWNLLGNKNRIIDYNEKTLSIVWQMFQGEGNYLGAKLINLQSNHLLTVIKKLSESEKRISDLGVQFSEGYHETTAISKGVIERKVTTVNIESGEMILTGPMISVSTPLFKIPQKNCKESSDYDFNDFKRFTKDEILRTVYVPVDKEENETSDFDSYRVGFRKMVDIDGERTLQPCLLPPKVGHVNSIISLIHNNREELCTILSLCSSVIYDFFIKTIGSPNIYGSRIGSLPFNLESKYKSKIFLRAMRLNCVDQSYRKFWEELFSDEFLSDDWTKNHSGLEPLSPTSKVWNKEVPLKNLLSRRQALVEIDVLTAMSFGLNVRELIEIYRLNFSISKKFEDDTWYDKHGNIVFTPSSKTLKGVGLDRSEWNQIKWYKEGQSYNHTIVKSELYKGEIITYYAPFDKCDRVEDYKTAWAHFEKVFHQENVETA